MRGILRLNGQERSVGRCHLSYDLNDQKERKKHLRQKGQLTHRLSCQMVLGVLKGHKKVRCNSGLADEGQGAGEQVEE